MSLRVTCPSIYLQEVVLFLVCLRIDLGVYLIDKTNHTRKIGVRRQVTETNPLHLIPSMSDALSVHKVRALVILSKLA